MTTVKVTCHECGNIYRLQKYKATLHTYEGGHDYLSWVESECTSPSCRAENRFFPEPDTDKKLREEGFRIWRHWFMPSHMTMTEGSESLV